jgi:hypothetical protein
MIDPGEALGKPSEPAKPGTEPERADCVSGWGPLIGLVVVAVLLLLVYRFAWPGRATRGIEDPAAMTEVIRAAVPEGSKVEEAERFMRHEGFDCDVEKEDLYCSRTDGIGPVFRRWQVLIEHRGGRVVGINSYTGLVGP